MLTCGTSRMPRTGGWQAGVHRPQRARARLMSSPSSVRSLVSLIISQISGMDRERMAAWSARRFPVRNLVDNVSSSRCVSCLYVPGSGSGSGHMKEFDKVGPLAQGTGAGPLITGGVDKRPGQGWRAGAATDVAALLPWCGNPACWAAVVENPRVML